jgi:hypothetical protein
MDLARGGLEASDRLLRLVKEPVGAGRPRGAGELLHRLRSTDAREVHLRHCAAAKTSLFAVFFSGNSCTPFAIVETWGRT